MAGISCMQSLQGILSSPLSEKDFKESTGETIDPKFLREFESAWTEFLSRNPLPFGDRCERIQALQQQCRELETSRDNVEIELKKQLEFFQNSRESLEDAFAAKLKEQLSKGQAVNDVLSARLDSIAIADHLQNQTLPWFNFLDQMDKLTQDETEKVEQDSDGEAHRKPRALLPSKRAMLLHDAGSEKNQSDVSDKLKLLRCFQIDHALLKTHYNTLEKEIQRYEKLIEAQEIAGMFLTEHNVWSILKTTTPTVCSSVSGSTASTAQSTAAATSRSGRAGPHS